MSGLQSALKIQMNNKKGKEGCGEKIYIRFKL